VRASSMYRLPYPLCAPLTPSWTFDEALVLLAASRSFRPAFPDPKAPFRLVENAVAKPGSAASAQVFVTAPGCS
jgi:hypothetical protein